MELDRLHIIYYSPTHTSKKIARSIGEGTGIARRQETDLTTDRGKAEITVRDAICVVAVPVYGGLVAPTAAERILRLKAVNCVGGNCLQVADAMFCHLGYAGKVGHYKAVEAPLLAEHIGHQPFVGCGRYAVYLVEGCSLATKSLLSPHGRGFPRRKCIVPAFHRDGRKQKVLAALCDSGNLAFHALQLMFACHLEQ